jgi:hypothetical protein
MCPICMNVISANEGNLISHLLANHPGEATALGLALSLANITLAKRPGWLLVIDALVLGVAIQYRRGFPA